MCIVYSKVKQRSRRCSDCRKSIKSVAVGGHAPTTATPPGKFYGKLCARNEVTSARFAVKFCRRAAEPSAACGGCSEAKQGQRSQNASAVQGAPHDAGTATRTYTRGNSRVRQSPCAAVAPCAACRVSRHAAQQALLFSRIEQRQGFFRYAPSQNPKRQGLLQNSLSIKYGTKNAPSRKPKATFLEGLFAMLYLLFCANCY